MMRMCMKKQPPRSEGEIRTRLGGNTGPAESDEGTDVESMLPMEWRRGPVLEPVGTLTTTRKMQLLVRARPR